MLFLKIQRNIIISIILLNNEQIIYMIKMRGSIWQIKKTLLIYRKLQGHNVYHNT
jgi:hypothetical protein